jgi:hypothetical protein
MNWFDWISLNRAAKRYARRLPAELRRCWGADDTYTPGQIRTAIATLKLPKQWSALGYAAFLNEADFTAMSPAAPSALTYDMARQRFQRYRGRPSSTAYAFENTVGEGNYPVA